MKQLDARGWECPKPVIETKKLMDRPECGRLDILVDNDIAVENLHQLASGLGWNSFHGRENGDYRVTIVKAEKQIGKENEKNKRITIVIASNQFGAGHEELGENLMCSYLYALSEETCRPVNIIFLNSGVFLTTKDSKALEILDVLETKGVHIYSCGVCLNFYGLTEQLMAGSVSNMYHIAEMMNHSDLVIRI